MSAGIDHRLTVDDEPVLLGEIVELGARIRMRQRDLNSFHVESLGKIDRVADRVFGLARQSQNEIAVDDQS